MENQQNSNLKSRIQKQQKKKIRKTRFYHSFLTIILLLIVCQIGYSALLNLAKIVVYQTKIIKAQELKDEAVKRNQFLKSEIENFNSMKKVESIARNNLKMAAKDEVLIIINQPHDSSEDEKKQDNKIIQFFEKFSSKFNRDMTPDKVSD